MLVSSIQWGAKDFGLRSFVVVLLLLRMTVTLEGVILSVAKDLSIVRF